jgi:hypothetical protein
MVVDESESTLVVTHALQDMPVAVEVPAEQACLAGQQLPPRAKSDAAQVLPAQLAEPSRSRWSAEYGQAVVNVRVVLAAIVCATLKVSVVVEMSATVTVPVMPVPVTTWPTVIFESAAPSVTAVEAVTAVAAMASVVDSAVEPAAHVW